MATLLPERHGGRPSSLGAYAEREVLRQLDVGLPDSYTVLHGVGWSDGGGPAERHGEIDLVIVDAGGNVLLLEVKSGQVDTFNETFTKRYGNQTKDVLAQVRTQYGVMRSRLHAAGLTSKLHTLLVLTDQQVRTETAQWPRARIIDCDELDTLCARVRETFTGNPPDPERQAAVVAFMAEILHLAPDVSALTTRAREYTRVLADGLATWVPRISSPSGLIRVEATAGSGKTQLALQLLRQADKAGKRAAYICFNRTLADHMSRVVPVRVAAETFHELARRLCLRAGEALDFSSSEVFDQMASRASALVAAVPPDLDLLVIDEMQDFQPEWVEALLSRLKAQGRAVLLEDPNQCLYADRAAFDLPDAVCVRSHENFRSPRMLVQLVNLLRLTAEPLEARGPLQGEIADPAVYCDEQTLLLQTEHAVQRCLDRGFGIHDIAVVTLRGRERSALLNHDRLGPWSILRFTGRYDETGNAVWTNGELLVDTVRRFKGQTAPAVVLTECEFTELDVLQRRLLFVGLTRASIHLEWVTHQRTSTGLAQRLAGGSGDGR